MNLVFKEKMKKIDLYKVFVYFLVFSFLGWIYEVLVVFVISGELLNRGYLFVLDPLGEHIPIFSKVAIIGPLPLVWGLPIIEMYGFGGLIIILSFRKFKNQKLKVFVYGIMLMTLYELLSSYFCTEVLGKGYWDYTNEFLNFQGRICLISSLAWGILSLVTMEFLKPLIGKLYHHLKVNKNFKRVVTIFFVYTIICAIYSKLIG